MTQSSIVRWLDILSALPEKLTEDQRKEAEEAGRERIAKWAVKAALSDSVPLLNWASGSIPTPDGRIARNAASIKEYEWHIAQMNKAIADFTRRRDQLIRERDILLRALEGDSDMH